MIILPVQLSTMKDSSSVFFIDLYVIHTITGDLYFASSDEDIQWYIPKTTTPVTYTAQPIERGDFSQSTDDKIDNVDIKISNVSEAFSSAMYQSFDFRGTDVDIIQIAYPGSLGDSTAYKHVFQGYIDTPGLDESTATFTATLMAKVPNMEGYRTLGLSCSAWFGDPEECGKAQDTRLGTVAANSTQTIIYHSTDGTSDNYWKSGVLSIGFESKKITSSTATSITVEYPFFTVPTTGDGYSVNNGCDGSKADCIRHDNLRNYGGYPGIPWELVVKS